MSSALLAVGAKAPDFTLPRDGGGNVTLSELRGQPVVVFFYPKASTPGCTTEARDFTALLPAFEAAGAKVLGISKDSVKRQENFVEKQELAMPLLSDSEATVCEDWGVWGPKQMMGRSYEGIIRSTFLIGADGTVAQVWSPVKVTGHAEAVLAAVRAL
jgi:peroxiredoxin Q/BCP